VRAVVYDRYGPPSVLRLAEVLVPVPGPEQVLVEVAATSINLSDWECLRGTPLYARIGGLRTPKRRTLGSDIAGRVVADLVGGPSLPSPRRVGRPGRSCRADRHDRRDRHLRTVRPRHTRRPGHGEGRRRHRRQRERTQERPQPSEGARAGASRQAVRGGARPNGFEPDRVTSRPDEAEHVRDAARRVLAGESLRSIVLDPTRRGILTPFRQPVAPRHATAGADLVARRRGPGPPWRAGRHRGVAWHPRP
jgi:hypothetical protein